MFHQKTNRMRHELMTHPIFDISKDNAMYHLSFSAWHWKSLQIIKNLESE